MTANPLINAVAEIAIAAVVFWAVYVAFGRRDLVLPDIRGILRRTDAVTDLCHFLGNKFLFVPIWVVGISLMMASPVAENPLALWLAPHLEGLPWALQLLACLILFDLAAYWRHRLMHTKALWPAHAVHHSSLQLNWLSGIRNHPLNVLAVYLSGALLMATLGFTYDVIATVGTTRFYWVCFIHCDVRLNLGPLNYVIATPDFHRWHHVTHEVRDKNFAGFFSAIDYVFGTLHLPKGERASGFGIGEPEYPTGYFGQLIAPFRRNREKVPVAATDD